MEIRSGPQAGDLGAVVRLHGLVYAAEYGLGAAFEASVAERMGELVARGWPGDGEGLWIVDSDQGPVGSITLSDEGDRLARLGHFVLLPEARGQGLGRRLVDAVLARARAAAHARIELFTFAELRSAARIYREAGFVRAGSAGRVPWGGRIEIERHTLDL